MYKVRQINIDAGEHTVIMNEKDAKELGVRSLERVKVFTKEHTLTAIVETSREMIAEGEIGLLCDTYEAVCPNDEKEVDLLPAEKPESVESIKKKMEGNALTPPEIRAIIKDIVNHNLSDIELTAYIVANQVRGMNLDETTEMTKAMVETGETLEFDKGPIFDFHSIGGVPGNKVTLLVVPIIASAGLLIPKTSSRAISSAGGTADIFEVLCNVNLPKEKIKSITETVGGVICWGGSVNMAPADDIIIRVEYPLSIDPYAQVIASVMAKKKAVGANYFLLDIPTGPNTKVPDMKLARNYARDFIEVGRRLGQWNSTTRTLSIDRTLVFAEPWSVVREVLKHEIAHQFVDEILKVREQAAHGPAFEGVCRRFGIDPRATGLPAAPMREEGGSPVLRRIARLLALAESPNVHEAEAAMKTAQRLMLKHNLEVDVAAAKEGYAFLQLGAPRQRVDAAEHVLAGLLARHFFVEAIWVSSYLAREARRGRVLELCGTLSNLEVASYVHGFLLETADRLWREHKKRHGIDSDKERRRFQAGVMIGFDEKLKAGVAEGRREGLIWVGDAGLEDFLHQRYPRRTGGGGIGVRLTAAYEHGRQAGRKIVLHKPVKESRAGGRLLGPAK